MRLLVWSQISGRLTNTPVHIPQARPTTETMCALADQIASQRLSAVIEQTFSLAQTADAIADLETRHATAKIVITID